MDSANLYPVAELPEAVSPITGHGRQISNMSPKQISISALTKSSPMNGSKSRTDYSAYLFDSR